MLRRIARFGATTEMRDRPRSASILGTGRRERAAKRAMALELHHIEALRAAAHAMGRP